MRRVLLHFYHYLVAAAGLAILLAISSPAALLPHLPDLLLFLALSVIVKRAGFHVAPNVTHSLVGVMDLAALMTWGAAGGGWIAGLSGAIHLVAIWLRHRNQTVEDALSDAAFSFGLKACMAVGAAALYAEMGGPMPLAIIAVDDIVPIGVLCLVWFLLDHVGWGLGELIEKGEAGATAFFRAVFKASLLVELLPLPAGALLAYLYATLSRPVFAAIGIGVVVSSIAVQRVADLAQAYIKRDLELQTLNDFAVELSRLRLDEQQVLELVYRFASRVADTANFAISLEKESSGEVELPVWFIDGVRQTPRRYTHWGGLAGWVVRNRRAYRSGDVNRVPAPAAGFLPTTRRTRAVLFVPLLTRESVIGAVSLQSSEPYRFSADQERILVALANQAAQEIVQARLYRAEQKRTRQLETIAEVSRRVAGIFDLDDLLEFVTALIKINFAYYHVEIFLLQGEQLIHRAGTVPGRGPDSGWHITQTSIISTVANSGEPLLVNDVTREPRYMFDPAAPRTAAEVAVPLRGEGKTLGVLEVQADEINFFSPVDLNVIQTLADQVALALQEAELFANVQHEAYVSNALLQVADAMNSLTSVHEILATLVRITPFLVGVRHCFVLRWDAADRAWIGGESHGLCDDCARDLHGRRFREGSLFVGDEAFASAAPRAGVLRDDFAVQWGIERLQVIPMLIRGTMLGAFCVDAGIAGDERRAALLAAMANQTAIAVEAVELEMERDLRATLDQELAIGRSIQASLLPPHAPRMPGFDVAAIWLPARQVAGDFFDFVPLLDQRWGLVVADVSDKGVPAAIYMTLSRTVVRAIALGRATRRTPAQVLERANEIIVADTRADLFVTVFYCVIDPASRRITTVNAGHCPPLLYCAEEDRVEWIWGEGDLPLGVADSITLHERERHLHPGDVLVMYTDGVTEAFNPADELFDRERLRAVVLAHRHQSAQQITDEIIAAVRDFSGVREQADDLTIVVVKCDPGHNQ